MTMTQSSLIEQAIIEAALPSGVRDVATDQSILDIADMVARAEEMGLGLAKLPVADVRRILSAIEPAPAPSHAETVAPYAASLRMIRDAVGELFGPVSDLESEEAVLLRGPEPHHEAEAIIAGLQRVKGGMRETRPMRLHIDRETLTAQIEADPDDMEVEAGSMHPEAPATAELEAVLTDLLDMSQKADPQMRRKAVRVFLTALGAERERLEREAQDWFNGQELHADRANTAESRVADLEKALTRIAEGNLGDDPWQANYECIRQVAFEALHPEREG